MRKKMIKKGDISSTTRNITGIILSAAIGTVICMVISLAFSYIFANAEILTDSFKAFFVASVLLGVFFCGIFSSRLTYLKGIVSGVLSSIIYLLIITVIMLFFSSGKLSANTAFLYLGIIVVGVIGGICGANIKRRK